MAEVLDGSLVRVTVTAGTRRADLALPGAVPVAELVPDLARGLGLLAPATAHRGYTLLTLDGRRFAPSLGLRDQGVVDGSVLSVVPGTDVPEPPRYDDPVEELTAAAPGDAVGSPEVALGAGAVAAGALLGRALPSVERGLAVPLAMILVGVLLAAGLFPRLALAVGGAHDPRGAHRILTGLTLVSGLLLVGVAPLLATFGRWGIALASTACLAVVLGGVRLWRGRSGRLLDRFEGASLAALPPLLLLVSGLLARVPVR